MDDRNDETEISTCEVESEQQIVTINKALTAYKIMCHMYFGCAKYVCSCPYAIKLEKKKV
jgi:hypothetical protein